MMPVGGSSDTGPMVSFGMFNFCGVNRDIDKHVPDINLPESVAVNDPVSDTAAPLNLAKAREKAERAAAAEREAREKADRAKREQLEREALAAAQKGEAEEGTARDHAFPESENMSEHICEVTPPSVPL